MRVHLIQGWMMENMAESVRFPEVLSSKKTNKQEMSTGSSEGIAGHKHSRSSENNCHFPADECQQSLARPAAQTDTRKH